MKTSERAHLRENLWGKGLEKGFHRYNGRGVLGAPGLAMGVHVGGLRKRGEALGDLDFPGTDR